MKPVLKPGTPLKVPDLLHEAFGIRPSIAELRHMGKLLRSRNICNGDYTRLHEDLIPLWRWWTQVNLGSVCVRDIIEFPGMEDGVRVRFILFESYSDNPGDLETEYLVVEKYEPAEYRSETGSSREFPIIQFIKHDDYREMISKAEGYLLSQEVQVKEDVARAHETYDRVMDSLRSQRAAFREAGII